MAGLIGRRVWAEVHEQWGTIVFAGEDQGELAVYAQMDGKPYLERFDWREIQLQSDKIHRASIRMEKP